MDDRTLQRKLEQLAKLANELDAEAKARYGPAGQLFYEADSGFHIMSGDSERTAERLTFVEFSSTTVCRLGAGAW